MVRGSALKFKGFWVHPWTIGFACRAVCARNHGPPLNLLSKPKSEIWAGGGGGGFQGLTLSPAP